MLIFKRILCTLAALAMIAAGAALFMLALHADPTASGSGGGEDKYMFLEQVDTRMRVDERGGLTVTELLSYDLGSKNWRGLYQDIILNHGEKVESVSVSRVSGDVIVPLGPGSGIELGVGGDYGTYGYGVVDDPSRRLRIVWNVNDSGDKQFLVRYKLRGAVSNHSDASSLLWEVWGTGWETGVGRLNVGVIFPGRMKSLDVRTDRLQDRVSKPQIRGRTGSFSVRDLPAGEFVEFRAAAEPLTRMPREAGEVLPRLASEQARIDAFNAQQALESRELRDRPYSWFLFRALIGALIGLVAVFLIYLWLGRDPTKKVSAGGSYQYPPEKIPAPVIVKALGGAETEHLVSATLLSLLQRDTFRMLPSTTKKEDVAIANNVGQSAYDGAQLTSWERPIADLLQSAIDAHPEHTPDFSKLKKHLSPTEAEKKIAEFDKALDAEMKQLGVKRTFRGYFRRTVFAVLAGGLYVIAVIAMLGNGGNDAAERWNSSHWSLPLLGFASVLLWAAIEGNAFYRLKPDQAERVRSWETYEDFFAEMDMSREYPLTIELWDEALVYGAAFGYAKKVITNMPRPAGADTSAGLGAIANNAYAASAIGSMTSGISGVTGMAAASSSSSSGGSSGGGSGGGGGGGW